MAVTLKPEEIQRNWRTFTVLGAQFQLHQGMAATRQKTCGCSDGWFSGDSTVILGSGEIREIEKTDRTIASWRVTIDPYWLHHFESGFLVIACLRYFGGLHSKNCGADANILMNDKHVDLFSLKIKPENHSDYFHRIPTPHIPCLRPPLSDCQTKYVWPIRRSNFVESSDQIVTVNIDKEANWDIDYVLIICHAVKIPQKVFLCHSSKDKDIARRLTDDLIAQGIGVWLDEAEIKFGDYLIKKLRAAIDSVQYLVVLISSASLKSSWVQEELDIAMKQNIEGKRITVVPILLEDCTLPDFLKDLVPADLRCLENYDHVLQKLVDQFLA